MPWPPWWPCVGAHVAQQMLQVVVGGALALVLGELLHVAVQAEVQTRQLLLHLTHVLQLLEGAHLALVEEEEAVEHKLVLFSFLHSGDVEAV